MGKKIISKLYAFTFFIVFFVFFITIINSMGCDYEFQTKKKGIYYLGICKGGNLSLVQTQVDTGDSWVIEYFQVSVFKQLFWIVKEKKHKVVSGRGAYINDVNDTSTTNAVYNYAWRRLNDKQIAVFQVNPTEEIYLVDIDGNIDTWDSIVGYKSVLYVKSNKKNK